MLSAFTKLNFPSIELKTRRNIDDGSISVWVAMRRTYLVLTPEEWVRRHVVSYLTSECGVQPTQICEEYPVKLGALSQRADIVVIDSCGAPAILVECKASSVAINHEVFSQAVRYNSVLKAMYVILTNGLKHYCYSYADGQYTPMKEFPKL